MHISVWLHCFDLQVFRWTFSFLSDQHIQCESKKSFLRYSDIVSPNWEMLELHQLCCDEMLRCLLQGNARQRWNGESCCTVKEAQYPRTSCCWRLWGKLWARFLLVTSHFWLGSWFLTSEVLKNDSVPGFIVDTPSIRSLQPEWSDWVHSTIALSHSMLAQNRQITNIHRQNQNRTSIRNIIHFIHTSLHCKNDDALARTTETASVTWCEHDINITCDWSIPHPGAVFHSFCQGRNQACPGESGHEKERKIS